MKLTATEVAQQSDDERSLHRKVLWFTEKWTTALDLNKHDAAEFAADFVTVIQAIHRDASRETHALLMNALNVMPPAPIIVPKSVSDENFK